MLITVLPKPKVKNLLCKKNIFANLLHGLRISYHHSQFTLSSFCQVKLELSGSGGGGGGGSSHPLSRHQPAHSASAAASPGSEQGGGGKDPANPDDPLAAIMNQTIFGGEWLN